MQFTKEQQAAIDSSLKQNTYINATAGAGKAQPYFAKVLTPNGFVNMGDLKIGDKVLTPNGNITSITHIHEQGIIDIYKTTYKDNRSSLSCDNHLWKVYNYQWSQYKTELNGYRIVSTKKLRSLKFGNKSSNRYYLPLVNNKTTILNNTLPLNPYLLGVLLGDGSFRDKQILLQNTEDDIINKLYNILPDNIKINKHNKHGLYSFSNIDNSNSNNLKNIIKALGLYNHLSIDKFIPSIYLNTSVDNKIKLIQGLMDTDGSVDKSLSYSTSSKQLANDIQQLIWSIGGICSISIRHTTYTYKNKIKNSKASYRLNIRINNPKLLISSKKHLAKITNNYQYSNLKLEIKNIEYYGKEKARCITIDSKEHLYVTDNYIVTHNSTTLAEIAKQILALDVNNKVLLVTFTNKSAKDIISKVGESTRISGGTFHSIAYRLMRNNNINFNICDTSKGNMIIKKIFDCKKDKEEFKNIKNEISITKSDYPQRDCEITSKYNLELAKYDMYDFDDIISNGIEFIKERQPEFNFTHILVDELQDTSKAQLELLIQMYNTYDIHIVGVGDLDQSIYEWRGARPDNVNDFIKKFKCVEKPLGLNFRSKNNIVAKARKLIEHNRSHKDIDIRAFDKSAGTIYVHKTNHPANEIDYAVSLCRRFRNKSITILYRDRTNKMQLEYQLRKTRINYKVNDSTEIVDRSAFRVYVAMMKVAAQDYDIYDLEIVAKGIKSLGTSTVSLIKSSIDTNTHTHDEKGQFDLFTAVDDESSFHSKVSKLADNNKKVKRGMIQAFKLQSEFKKIAKAELRLDTLVKQFPDFMIKSYEVPKEISEFLESITEDYDTTAENIKDLCNDFGLNATDEVYDENALVQLSTIHGFKGGEDDIVILPFCDWKFKEDDRVKDIVESERRLFYVAITRPKNALYLSYSGVRKPRFIEEMGV